jgi:hypothetical protein
MNAGNCEEPGRISRKKGVALRREEASFPGFPWGKSVWGGSWSVTSCLAFETRIGHLTAGSGGGSGFCSGEGLTQ